eukprot:256370-Rhodomonas_salina.1
MVGNELRSRHLVGGQLISIIAALPSPGSRHRHPGTAQSQQKTLLFDTCAERVGAQCQWKMLAAAKGLCKDFALGNFKF